jgi:uncharacterized phage protein gp47/JayE
MFDDKTYEALLQEVLDNAPDGIDTRQGSIFYDAVSGVIIKIAELYTDLDLVFTLTQVDTTSGEYLDVKASEYGLTRHAATNAKYNATFEGTTPESGERFFTGGQYFVLGKTDSDVLYLEAETAGTVNNGIISGTPAVPVNNIQGLESVSFGEILEYGTDTEEDESLRQRVREKIGGPAENGNKQHYKTWCESYDGVGKARIFPLWNGPNTVKAVLINPLGLPCSNELVADVQNYVDPAENGYTVTIDGVTYAVGDGLGEGAANLGAHFTAVSALSTVISVSFTAELASSYTVQDAQSAAETAITNYLKNMVLTSEDPADVVVRVSSIGAIIAGLDPILDYSNLKINDGTANIAPGDNYIPVMGTVTITT